MEQGIASKGFTRRRLLAASSALLGFSALSALQGCSQPTPTPTAAKPASQPAAQPAAQPTAAPAKPPATAAQPAQPTKAAPAAAPTKEAQAPEPTKAPAASPKVETRVGVEGTEWTAEKIRKEAGTVTNIDTKGAVLKVLPQGTKGQVTAWMFSLATMASPQVQKDKEEAFFKAWNEIYPGIPLKLGENVQPLDYAKGLDKLRAATAAKVAPNILKVPIMWSVELAAKKMLAELRLEDMGFTKDDFFPGAIKSNMWAGKLYGVPTNQSAHSWIWNKQIFRDAGLDPDKPPATWEDVVKYSKQIKQATGKAGYGLSAKVADGGTPFRYMGPAWAYGSGALDEAEPDPKYDKVLINNEGGIAALQLHYDMYVRDKSVPTGALTNTAGENDDLFLAGQLGMYSGHPSVFVGFQEKLKKVTGSDKAVAEKVVENIEYGPYPRGPVRKGLVFGGSNEHAVANNFAERQADPKIIHGFLAFANGPEWNVRFIVGQPSNLTSFKTVWYKEMLDSGRFWDHSAANLHAGIPFPVVPESTDMMNILIPEMMQNALTGKMTVRQAADDCAEKIKKLLAQRKS